LLVRVNAVGITSGTSDATPHQSLEEFLVAQAVAGNVGDTNELRAGLSVI
jgi:hypothetical protein